MQKKYRLKNGKVFDYLHRRGTSIANKLLVLVYAPSKFPLKVGFIVSKKVGKANVRNKVRRRLREIFRALIPFVNDNNNFIFIARQECAEADFYKLASAVFHLLCKQNLIARDIDEAVSEKLKLKKPSFSTCKVLEKDGLVSTENKSES